MPNGMETGFYRAMTGNLACVTSPTFAGCGNLQPAFFCLETVMHIRLREYQQRAVQDIRQAYVEGYRAPLYVLPTGGGKTVILAYIAWSAAKKGKQICILVHRDHLIWQTSQELREWGVPHGIIAPGMAELRDKPVQVASVWTLARRKHWLDQFDLWFVDEAHHAVAGTWERVLTQSRGMILGVTATPARLDGKGLGHIFDRMIFGPTMAELMQMGYLARARTFRPSEPPNLRGVHRRGGDFQRGEAEARMNQRTVTGDAIDHYTRILQGAPSLVFAVTNRHAANIKEQFAAAGYRAAQMTQDTPRPDRQQMLNDLAAGRLNVITSCEVISEGTDVPQCYGSILLRPTDSLVLFLQQIGRSLRPKPGDAPAVILDHAGNSHRHGLPEVDRQWSLDRGVAEDQSGAAPLRTCETCFAVMPSATQKCPVCGAEKAQPEAQRMPRQVAGELLEAEGVHIPKNTDPRTAPLKTLTRKATTLQQLKAIEQIRGYKPGWAERFYEAKKQAREQHRLSKSRERGEWRFS